MIKFKFLWLKLVLMCLLSLPLPVSAATHAILIGSGQYMSPAISDLAGPANDLQAMRELVAKFGDGALVVLKDDEATRSSVEGAIFNVGKGAKPGDWVILYYSGHGSQAKASDNINDPLIQFVPLAGFDPRNQSVEHFIADKDFYSWLKAYIPKDVNILMLVDSCHSGTMHRRIVPELYGFTARATLSSGGATMNLIPRPSPQFPRISAVDAEADAEIDRADLPNLVYFGAAQDDQLALETELPEEGGSSRGLLTFAFEQGLTLKGGIGNQPVADLNGDGTLVVQEMAAYLGGQVHLMSSFRQDSSAVFTSQYNDVPLLSKPSITLRASHFTAPSLFIDGAASAHAARGDSWRIAETADAADFFWDVSEGSVFRRSGDLVAAEVRDAEALRGVIEKWQTVQRLAPFVSEHVVRLAVDPAGFDALHRKGTEVKISIERVRKDALNQLHVIVFNLASDGTVQLIYPLSGDAGVISAKEKRLEILATQVVEPFGADHIIALTTAKEAAYLRDTLRATDGQRASTRLVEPILAELRKSGAYASMVAGELYTNAD
jgi:hypothetical protein